MSEFSISFSKHFLFCIGLRSFKGTLSLSFSYSFPLTQISRLLQNQNRLSPLRLSAKEAQSSKPGGHAGAQSKISGG